MDTSAYLKAVVEQTSTFADWVHGRDVAAPVPTCPKWTLADLVDHVGATQRMVAMLVGERMTEPSRAFASYVPAPTDSAQWRAWLTDAAAEAKQAFESVADDTPVWDPSGGAAGVPFWSRRLFGEAAGLDLPTTPDRHGSQHFEYLRTPVGPRWLFPGRAPAAASTPPSCVAGDTGV